MSKVTPEDLEKLREMNDLIQEITDRAAKKAAAETVRRLGKLGRITYVPATSYQKTERLLYLFPKLPQDQPDRQRVAAALEQIRDDEYAGIIPSKYFDGFTIAEIAEEYGAKYQTISKQRARLIRILAQELFPEDVLDEIVGRREE